MVERPGRHLQQCSVRIIQRADGYGYAWPKQPVQQPKEKATTAARSAPFLTALKDGVSRSILR
jgi:hypothetical protein